MAKHDETERAMTRVLVISQDSTLRYCLASLFDEECAIEATFSSHDIDEISTKSNALLPDIALIDVLKRRVDSVRLVIETVKASSVLTRTVLLVVEQGNPDEVALAFGAGISGYLCRDAPISQLIPAIKAIAAGLAVTEMSTALVFSEQFTEISGGRKFVNHHRMLTSRELEILRLVAQGYRDKEIATKLALSPRTVRNHIANTMLKMGVDSRAQAIFVAVRENIIDVPMI